MADTIDTRLRHLRSRTPLNVKAPQNAEESLAPDQQSVDLEPLTAERPVNAGSAEGRFCLAWVPQAFSLVLLRWPRPLR